MVAARAATCAIPLSKWLVFIRPSLAGFDCPLTQQFIQLNWPTNAGSPFWWLQSATSFNVGTVWETHLWATNPPIIWPMTNQERYFRLFQTN